MNVLLVPDLLAIKCTNNNIFATQFVIRCLVWPKLPCLICMHCDRIVFLFYVKHFLVETPIRNDHLVKLDPSFLLINHHYFKTTAKYRSLNGQEWAPLENNHYYYSALYTPTKVVLTYALTNLSKYSFDVFYALWYHEKTIVVYSK